MHLKIHPHRRILAIPQFPNDMDMILPDGVLCPHIHKLRVIFRHQVQSVHGLVPELFTFQGKLIIHPQGSTIEFVPNALTIDVSCMDTPFTQPEDMFGGSDVVTIKNYNTLDETDVKAGTVTKLDFPCTSNVLQYFTADGTKVSVRPSGTEPKIKFYVEVHGTMQSAADYEKAIADARQKIEDIKKDLGI